jgi:site-specific DNA-methyltransferase (adenine-specific)
MITLHNMDCLEAMRGMPDKAFELAIVDPPYGIGDKLCIGGCKKPNRMQEMYLASKWEDVAPLPEYFNELMRVSKNQIIWGGNYFDLKPTRGFIVWDKVKFATNYSQCEYAWTSFDCVSRIFKFCSNGGFVVKPEDLKIHPTQKPVALYRWLLANYAKPGDRILDTHLGSGSIAIACHDAGFDLTGYELDKDYYEAACKRLKNHQAQGQFAL